MKMDPEFSKIAVGIVILIGGFLLAIVVLLGKGRKRAERLAPAFELGTSGSTGFLGSAVGGLYRGYSCRYQVQYASQYDRGGATLRVAAASPHPWTAEIEKPGTRLLSRFGLVKDSEIGDRELDEHLRFAAGEEGSLRSLFGSQAVLDAMHVLAASENFESVQVRAGAFNVKWAPRVAKLDEEPEVLRARLEYVTTLIIACGYPPVHPPTR
jgi:hypothetical protein